MHSDALRTIEKIRWKSKSALVSLDSRVAA
jgi:hypothetical protein